MEHEPGQDAAPESIRDRLAARYGLAPLPTEGGLFRSTWAGPAGPDGRPAGTAIMMLLTSAVGDFSALHRLPIDEVWHFYRGDPLDLLLLEPDGSDRLVPLGGPGGTVQITVPAGTWMGAQVCEGGSWSLFGTTMAPGFLPSDYEGGDPDALARAYPRRATRIRTLCRTGAPLTMGAAGGGVPGGGGPGGFRG